MIDPPADAGRPVPASSPASFSQTAANSFNESESERAVERAEQAEAALADLRAQIARLEQAWRTDAKEHHLAAANFAAIDAQADYMRHLDVAGTYRKCADAHAALRPAGAEEP